MGRQQHSPKNATAEDIATIYERDFGRFIAAVMPIVGNRDLAYDTVQDAFATALNKKSSLRARGALEPWLWRIVVNRARDQRRRTRQGAVRVTSESRINPEAVTGINPEAVTGSRNGTPVSPDDVVRSAVARLPERQRLVLFLRYYAELDYNEIAAALAVRPGTVAATLHAARQAVRRGLEGDA